MKVFRAISLLGALAASSVIPACAQSYLMRVNVPFAFMVGNEKMEAGEYQLQNPTDGGVVFIQGSKTVAVLTTPLAPANGDAKASLVFTNANDIARLVTIQPENEPSRSINFHAKKDVKLSLSR